MRSRGFSLIEFVVVAAVASLVVLFSIVYSTPWRERESVHGAENDVASFLQLAKIEATSRNRPCRFVVDAETGDLGVWDSVGTAAYDDDAILERGLLPASVRLARPDPGEAITLERIGSTTRFQAVFAPDGTVVSGAGDLFLHGGDAWRAVTLEAAGGVAIRRWSGGGWVAGY